QVQGSGSSQQLIIQWNNASFYGGNYTGQVTLEAILNANGTMIFNYKNLTSGDANSDAASATVGIKDAGTQGSDRLLVSYNSSSSPFVATGKSLEIGVGLASNVTDYYAYSLAAGQTTTLAVTGQKSATVGVSLQDSQGNTLATGMSPGSGSNVNSAIDNFVAPAAGTYYAVVTGTTGAAYSLVVNRDADFDTEVNGSFSSAQNISGTKGVLGDILAAPANPTENWYSIGLTAGNELLLQTSTPGSAGSPLVNNLAPVIQLYSPSDILVASGQGAGNQSLSAVATATGAYRIRVLGGNSTSGEYYLSTSIVAHPTPPEVQGVYARSSAWNSSFLSYLAASGLGSAQLGYQLLGGANQLAPLPWTNITTLSVVFTQDVSVNTAAAGLALVGSPDLPAAPGLAGATFSYDNTTHTAQWTFASPLALDKYLFSIPSTAVVNSVGVSLDGEWTNATGNSPGSQFPSGDGVAGGDFNFRFNLLPGDVDQNGAVTGADGNSVRALLLQSTGSTSYSPMADLNGDGTITGLDGAVVRLNLLQTLPATDPTQPNQGAVVQGAVAQGSGRGPSVAGSGPGNGSSPSLAAASAPAATASGAGSSSQRSNAPSTSTFGVAPSSVTAAPINSSSFLPSLSSPTSNAIPLTPAPISTNLTSLNETPPTGRVQDPIQSPPRADRLVSLLPAATFNATRSTRSAIRAVSGDFQAQLHDLVIEEFARRDSSPLWASFSR
ncbi:MAG TPA: dockerin type I domain-containing protein, partial [Pirellulales bacterium]|nr:dockerin type I domain-containing protein [Pirellulales bacterium]